MNESHKGLRDLNDCSCDNLNELTQLALDSGSIGTKITGAGWGGCCISLVKTDQIDEFMNALEKFYLKQRGEDKH